MGRNKKIVCLGGGSLYFPGAIAGLLANPDLSGSEIVLYDIDAQKAEMMAGLGNRLVRLTNLDFKVRAAARMADAVDGADFAISSIGGSGAEVTPTVYGSYYHNVDVRIPVKYGIQQVIGDTCGPAGMMMAFRSIPAYLRLCRAMEKRCPNVIFLNHSNPMAVLCRAMHKYSSLTVIGICHGVQIGIAHTAEILGVPPQELECIWIGTNHYYWFTRVYHQGRNVYPELMRRIAKRLPADGRELSTRLSRIYGHYIVYPEDDHVIEFYPLLTQVRGGFSALPYGLAAKARAHGYDPGQPIPKRSASQKVRREFLKNYQTILDKIEFPKERDASITGENIGKIIGAIANGRREVCIANVANKGAVPNLPATAEVEVEAVTDSRGVRPVHMGDAPPVLKAMLEKRFAWQELVVDAAVKGDRNLALQALMLDEMAIVPEKAEPMLAELLQASRDLLPQFFNGRR